MATVLVLGHDQMGQGDETLGRKILGTFLRKSVALRDLTAIVLFNSGVKLVADGSSVLGELQQLHDEHGVDLRPCGTCLEHYGLSERIRVGTVCGMDDIIAELAKAEKVISL